MKTSINGRSLAEVGVLVHSDRLPRVEDLQEWISRSGYPCELDPFGLEDKRGLFSAQVLGTQASVRFELAQIAHARPPMLVKGYEQDRELNVQMNWPGIHGDHALACILLLAIAETSGGIVWDSEGPEEINHEAVKWRLGRSLGLLKLLKWVGDGNVVTPQSPELSSWESSKLRENSISCLSMYGIIEENSEEQSHTNPYSYQSTRHGAAAARMCY